MNKKKKTDNKVNVETIQFLKTPESLLYSKLGIKNMENK